MLLDDTQQGQLQNAFQQLQDPQTRLRLAESLAQRFPPPPRNMFVSNAGTGNVTLDSAGVARARLSNTPEIVQPTTPGLRENPSILLPAALQFAQFLQAMPGQNGRNNNLATPGSSGANVDWQAPAPAPTPAPAPSPAPQSPSAGATSPPGPVAAPAPAPTPAPVPTPTPNPSPTPAPTSTPTPIVQAPPATPVVTAPPTPTPTPSPAVTPPPSNNTPPAQGIPPVLDNRTVTAPPAAQAKPLDEKPSTFAQVDDISKKASIPSLDPVSVAKKTDFLGVGTLRDLFGDGGNLAKESRVYATENGTFYDQNGKVITQVQIPTSGMVAVPGLNRNGNPIFVDSAGNILKKQQSGGGFDNMSFNLRSAGQSPKEINGVTAKWDAYKPMEPTQANLSFGGTTPQVGTQGQVNPNVTQPGSFNPANQVAQAAQAAPAAPAAQKQVAQASVTPMPQITQTLAPAAPPAPPPQVSPQVIQQVMDSLKNSGIFVPSLPAGISIPTPAPAPASAAKAAPVTPLPPVVNNMVPAPKPMPAPVAAPTFAPPAPTSVPPAPVAPAAPALPQGMLPIPQNSGLTPQALAAIEDVRRQIAAGTFRINI